MKKKRVGITSDIQERKRYWQSQYRGLTLEIVAEGLTYEEAQEKENEYLAKGYEGSPGGERVPGRVYSVYVFYYTE